MIVNLDKMFKKYVFEIGIVNCTIVKIFKLIFRSLGYNYEDNGEVEKQDKFLRRMSGMMRLYAALLVSTPARGQNHPHPHGLENAWR